MGNYDDIKSVISTFSGTERHITVPRVYLEMLGDFNTAAFLNQLIFWSDKTRRKDGYFYKTYTEWNEELLLSEYQVRRSAKILKEQGFINTKLKKANGSPTLHYKVNMDKLSESILKKLKNRNLTNLSNDTEVSSVSLTVDDTVDEQTVDSASRSKLKFETHHLKLAELLYKQIQSNLPNFKEPNLEKWANEFRLIMERDKREGKEIQDLIIKTQNDDFWKKNILSPSKLRKQYDRLVIEFEDNNKFENNNNIKTRDNAFDYLDEL